MMISTWSPKPIYEHPIFFPFFPSWLHIAIECILLLTTNKFFSLFNCQVFSPSSLLIITKLFFDLLDLLMLIDYISRGLKKQTLLSFNALFLFILNLFLQSFKLLVWRFLGLQWDFVWDLVIILCLW